ncbi:S-layer homology domain-containing protein [Crocosphaera sp. Alani8]|uniref:S-layer homology domain-containing protein n=1 Tax=Crocosphaera sp. Alani8 TaxID=3038952 RepID=UPI00313CE23F
MIQSKQQLPTTSSQQTLERITSFEQRYGEAHLQLAYHAAVPLALTPDLLYRLWAEFQWDMNKVALNVPWVAVTDLLFSCLCDEVGSELYEMDEEIRQELLYRLQQDSRFSSLRIREVAEFLLTYVRPQLESPDIDLSDFAKSQRWTALTYTNPKQAAQEIAAMLSTLSHKDLTEWERLTSVLELFAEELSDYKPLLVYARGMKDYVQGDVKGAAKILTPVLDENNQIRVAGVNLPIPDSVKARFSRLTIAANFLKRYRQIIGVVLIASVPLFIIYYLSTRSLIVRPPSSITNIALDLPGTHPLHNTERVTSVSELRDISPRDWYYEALRSLAERYGIIYPYEDGSFRPNQAMTKAELINWEGNAFRVFQSLVQEQFYALGKDTEQIFKSLSLDYKNNKCLSPEEPKLNTFRRPNDVKTNDWYYESYQIVNWISDHSFMAPKGSFAGNEPVLRGNMSMFINRFLNGFERILTVAVAGCRQDIEKAKTEFQQIVKELKSQNINLEDLEDFLNFYKRIDWDRPDVSIPPLEPSSPDTKTLPQVTSTSELQDSSPTSLFYEDLRGLVERYGCAVGDPYRRFTPENPTPRRDMAALMNACLNVMERLIQENVAVLREDIEKLKQLMNELDLEINALINNSEISEADKKKLKQILK